MLETLPDKLNTLVNREDTRLGQVYALVMAFLVLCICGLFVAQTYAKSEDVYELLVFIESVITVVFVFDYVIRWWAARFSWRYPFTPFAIIDLISILPIFFYSTHWQFIRILRIFRILRLLRVFQTEGLLFWRMTEFHLRVLRIFFTVFCLIFIYAATIYDIEHEKSGQFNTFFDCLYFAVISLSTVGYGDMVPVSNTGRGITLIAVLLWILLIPWQLANLARHLIEGHHDHHFLCEECGLSSHEDDAAYCKHCGAKLVKNV